MSFVVGDRYLRQSDGMTAVVKHIDETGAVLRLDDGERERIRAMDVPGGWRLYEFCPECFGTGNANALQHAKADFAKSPTSPACPECSGSGRVYPEPSARIIAPATAARSPAPRHRGKSRPGAEEDSHPIPGRLRGVHSVGPTPRQGGRQSKPWAWGRDTAERRGRAPGLRDQAAG
jgi:hypothetical protein